MGKRIKDGLIGVASSGAIAIQYVVVPSYLTCHRSGHHCSSGWYSFEQARICWGNQADSSWIVCYLADNAARALGLTACREADNEGCALRVEMVEEVLLGPATTA